MLECKMNTDKLYGYLVVTNVCRKQIYEYKKLFAKTIGLNQIERNRWKLTFRKWTNNFYKLSFLFDGELEGYWIVLPIQLPQIKIDDLKFFNEKSETMLKEEWIYGIKDFEGLDAMLGQVDNGFYGITLYPTILKKATYFWYHIATRQMFNNGNKRTALLTALVYLKGNGYKFDILDEVLLYNISIRVANKQLSFQQLYQYILNHTFIDFSFSRNILNS